MSIETQAPSLNNELSELASWARERTSDELQSFVGRRLALVTIDSE